MHTIVDKGPDGWRMGGTWNGGSKCFGNERKRKNVGKFRGEILKLFGLLTEHCVSPPLP